MTTFVQVQSIAMTKKVQLPRKNVKYTVMIVVDYCRHQEPLGPASSGLRGWSWTRALNIIITHKNCTKPSWKILL